MRTLLGNRRLSDIIRQESDIAVMQSMRHGASSKTNRHLPTVLTTRKGLYPGAIIQIDDVWHDNFVTIGRKEDAVRVLEIGAIDLFSACRTHWGMKPRVKNKSTGKFENLRAPDIRQFISAYFYSQCGYSPRGSMMMAEHGAAAIDERIERLLFDATGGLIRIDRQPIEKVNALLGFWNGTEGGNFRAKAALESSHNIIHNDLANISLQTGKDASNRPVTTDRQLSYISSILKDVHKHCPEVAHLLKLPTLFVEFKGDVDIIPTKRKYKQHYGGLFHVQNGKIKLFREYFNPAPFKYAFGLDEKSK